VATQPLRQREWVVYTKRSFAGPEAVLAYLSRYTHHVAIVTSRLIAVDEQGVTFKFIAKENRDFARAPRGGRHRITLNPRHSNSTLLKLPCAGTGSTPSC
jgi:hypothetical protein